ncbi:hypothetical protein WDU94_003580 [Cyamophila willieti]
MKPTVNVPTRITPTRATCIDNIFINFSPKSILNPVQNLFTGIGDHKHAQVISFPIKDKEKTEKVFMRSYTNNRIISFSQTLADTDFNPIQSYSSDVNAQVSLFYNIFLSAFNSHFPLKSISLKNHKRKEWITKGILISTKKKRALFNLTLHSDDPSLHSYYHSYCKILQKTVRAAKRQHAISSINKAPKQKKIKAVWTLIKSYSKSNRKKVLTPYKLKVGDRTVDNSQEVANMFNKYWVNIAQEINPVPPPSLGSSPLPTIPLPSTSSHSRTVSHISHVFSSTRPPPLSSTTPSPTSSTRPPPLSSTTPSPTSSSTRPPPLSSTTPPPTSPSTLPPPFSSSTRLPPTSSTLPPPLSSTTPSPTSSSTRPPPLSSTRPPPTSSTRPPPLSSSTRPLPTSSSSTRPPPLSSTRPPSTSSTRPLPTTSTLPPPLSSTTPSPTSSSTRPPPLSSTRPPSTSSTRPPPLSSSTRPLPTSSSSTLPPPLFLLEPCSPHEIIKIVNNLQNKTSCGEDSVPMTLVKKVIPIITEPLSFIFNTSFRTSTFPQLFKSAIITPIHKKGPMSDLNNFRPISLLNSFSKILEKIVASRLTSYLEHYRFLTESQFGFRSHRSTSDAVSHFLQKLNAILSSKHHAVAIFCDLTKAFDCVDHSLLLSKLSSFGLHGSSLQWFTSYLSHRHQQVKVPKSAPSTLLTISHSSSTPSYTPSQSSPPPPTSSLSCTNTRPPSSILHQSNTTHRPPTLSITSLSFPSLPPLPYLSSSLPCTSTTHLNYSPLLTTNSSRSPPNPTPIPPFSLPPPSPLFSLSSPLQTKAGVPQGSVLGPLLFLHFINDITSADPSAHLTLFADDTTVLVSAQDKVNVFRRAAEVISKIHSWFQTNKLYLNEGKTSYLYFNSSSSSSLPPLLIPGLSIYPSTEVKFLGLIVDCNLKWKSHLEQLHAKLSTAIFVVRSVRKNVDSCAALLAYHSYFHSLMSYAIVFWGFHNINPILILQKRAVRAVFGLWHWSNEQSVSCKPLFKKHKILTVYAQVILDTCVLIHKISPSLPRHRDIHQHGTRGRNNIVTSGNMLMDKSFLKQGISLYNKLPLSVREMREEMFKSTLKDALVNLAPYSVDEFQGDLGVHGR